jgi:hypothetical protein
MVDMMDYSEGVNAIHVEPNWTTPISREITSPIVKDLPIFPATAY